MTSTLSRTLLLLLGLTFPVVGQTRDIILQTDDPTTLNDLVNPNPAFMLRIRTDRVDRVYEEGDHFRIHVTPERDCYLHIINLGPTGKVNLLFPTNEATDNLVKAYREQTLPTQRGTSFVVSEPFGAETIFVLATTEPLNLADAKDVEKYRGQALREKSIGKQHQGLKDIHVQVRKHLEETEWVAYYLQLHTQKTRKPLVAKGASKKWLVSIGISEYKSRKHEKLNAAEHDARAVAEVLTKQCGFELVGKVLTNRTANSQAVHNLLGKELPNKAKPGDLVVIYWSGHGGRIPDRTKEEKDGYDEYLQCYDLVLLDDSFFFHTSKLEGCKVVFILDSCHAAGTPKSLGTDIVLDSFDGEVGRTRDLGNSNHVLLAACRADQEAYEMRDGKRSVMTYFLLEVLSKRNKLTVEDAFLAIKEDVQKYVRDNLEQKQQVPVLEGSEAKNYFLK